MSQEKHTPTPWRKCGGATPHYCAIVGPDNSYIIHQMADRAYDEYCGTPVSAPRRYEQMANAAFICRAVNCHDQLVEACRTALDCLDDGNESDGEAGDALRAALAAATAERTT